MTRSKQAIIIIASLVHYDVEIYSHCIQLVLSGLVIYNNEFLLPKTSTISYVTIIRVGPGSKTLLLSYRT